MPLKQRRGRPAEAQAVFEAAAYSRLPWPGKTTRLERDSLRDLVERSASPHVSVAELYHENSKLFPAKCAELLASGIDVSAFRHDFVRRRTRTRQNTSEYEYEHPIRALLTSVAGDVDAELFYALELRLVADGSVLLHEPGRDVLIEVKRVQAEGPTLYIVASFARNELLFGARGYRHTLLDAGRLAEQLVSLARHHGLETSLSFDFEDWQVNGLLEADGVEEGAIVAVELRVRDDT
jgi:hypothetical protein